MTDLTQRLANMHATEARIANLLAAKDKAQAVADLKSEIGEDAARIVVGMARYRRDLENAA